MILQGSWRPFLHKDWTDTVMVLGQFHTRKEAAAVAPPEIELEEAEQTVEGTEIHTQVLLLTLKSQMDCLHRKHSSVLAEEVARSRRDLLAAEREGQTD
jgi:hypothetical protein